MSYGNIAKSDIDNVLNYPATAANYLRKKNLSTYVSADEARLIADAMDKFALSKKYSRIFLDKWKALKGEKVDSAVKGTIYLNGSGFSDFSTQQKRVAASGKTIYDMALLAAQDIAEATQQSQEEYNYTQQQAADYEAGKELDQEASRMKVKDTVNVRAQPDAKSTKIGSLKIGSQVIISNKDTGTGTWARIIYNSMPGYIQRQYIVSPSTKIYTTTKTTTTTTPTPITTPVTPVPEDTGMSTSTKLIIVGSVVAVGAAILYMSKNKEA